MRHMRKKFAFGRICLPYPLQKFHNRLLLPLSRHHSLRDVLMVSVQADSRFFECFVRNAAAADINFSQLGVIPGIDYLGAPGFHYFPHRFLYHLHIIRRNTFKPSPVAFLRLNLIRHAQKNPHGPVRKHPGLAALLKFNRPYAGSGALQNVLEALSCLQLVFFFLLHNGIDIALRKNRTVLLLRLLRGGKMKLQVL